MTNSRNIRFCGVAVTVGALIGPVATSAVARASTTSSSSPTPTVLVSGLNNPRQLSLVTDSDLLIAEAGSGGSTKVGSGKNAQYVGTTGAVSEITYPEKVSAQSPQRVVTGLLSAASKTGVAAVGSDGVSENSLDGLISVIETYAPPDVIPTPLPGAQLGHLLYARENAGEMAIPHIGADITAFEQANDPDGQGFASDPYAVLDLGHHQRLVADAAGNDVLMTVDGQVSLFHVFGNVTSGACAKVSDPTKAFPGCNYVPTSLATDAHGNVYVGGLVSEVAGAGEVTELDPSGTHVLHTWTGFTSVDGVAVGPDGSLYVSQLEAQEAHPINPQAVGVLTKVSPDGTETNVDVPFAAGVAVDDESTVYVSAFSIAPSTGLGIPGIDTSGQVWRLQF